MENWCNRCLTLVLGNPRVPAVYRLILTNLDGDILDTEGLCRPCAKAALVLTSMEVK